MTLASTARTAAWPPAGPCTKGPGRAGSGFPGMPAEAEEVMVARDIALARATGGRIHFLHLSTAGSIDLVRRAKAEGVPVTAEAAPHHFTLTDALRRRATTRCSRSTRRSGPRTTWTRSRRPWPTGRPTPSPPTTPPTPPSSRTCPSTRPHRACSGLQTALALAVTELDLPAGAHRWPCSAGSRRPSPASTRPTAATRAARWRPGAGRQPVRGRPHGHLDGGPRPPWPAGAGTRPYAGGPLTGRVRHTVLAGEPVVVDAEARR